MTHSTSKKQDRNFVINEKAIFDSMLSIPSDGIDREIGADLVDKWIRKFGVEDMQLKIEAVELGFIVYVDSLTAVIGVQDAIMRDKVGLFGNEWKSVKEPKSYNGKDTWYWNEDVWIKDISNGAQIQIYALALNRGTFYEKDKREPTEFFVKNPRIRTRAIVKSTQPRFWPTDGKGVYQFDDTALATISEALRAKANSIRALRNQSSIPWQLTGKQCFPFGNECPFYSKYCSQHVTPVMPLERNEKLNIQFDASDPAAEAALPFIPKALLDNPDFIVLSASQYTLASDCLERYRIVNGNYFPKHSDDSQSVGSVFHAGIAEFYRQLRDRK